MQDNRQLRVGLLVDSLVVSNYVRDLIAWVETRDNLTLSRIVVSGHRPPSANLLSRLIFNTIVSCEIAMVRAYHAYRVSRDHFRVYDITGLVRGIDILSLSVADPQVQLLETLEIDLLVDCGSGLSYGDLPNETRMRVISLGHWDNVFNRPGPPGFWECYHRRDGTRFIIQSVADRGGRVDVLRSGTFPTQFLYSLNRAHLYTKYYEHLKDLLKTLAETETPSPVPAQPNGYALSPDPVPEWRYSMVYLLKISYRIAKRVAFRMFGFRQCWSISILPGNWAKAEYWKSSSLQPPRGRFWADPFFCKADNRTYCFVEEFVFRKQRGHIAAFEIPEQNFTKSTAVLVEDFHLSFPFIFEYQGTTFMCPECSESREVRIYRCVELPHRWELAKVIMRDVSAADTMIFSRNGKWWMLTNITTSDIEDYCTELYLFYAESPFENWTAHPQNPIKVDCQGGRNAGLLVEGDKIFRVGQRQGFDQYGRGIWVYEITLLTEDVYVETLVWELDADFRPGLLGVHHLSSTGEVTAIDHVRWTFAWSFHQGAPAILNPSRPG